jgi:hypothetical protein
MGLTNCPKGKKEKGKIKLGTKSSCEDQGNKKMKRQERNTEKSNSDKVISLCCSTITGVQVLHTTQKF